MPKPHKQTSTSFQTKSGCYSAHTDILPANKEDEDTSEGDLRISNVILKASNHKAQITQYFTETFVVFKGVVSWLPVVWKWQMISTPCWQWYAKMTVISKIPSNSVLYRREAAKTSQQVFAPICRCTNKNNESSFIATSGLEMTDDINFLLAVICQNTFKFCFTWKESSKKKSQQVFALSRGVSLRLEE